MALFLHWLFSFVKLGSGSSRAGRGRVVPIVRRRPRVELLEERTLLAWSLSDCVSADPFICTPLPPSHEGLALHIHPNLRIVINGQQQLIPAEIGIVQAETPGGPVDTGFLPLHTHDATGKIHVESPIVRDFHLKDFFDVWGYRFNAQEVLGYLTDASRPLEMTVNGQPSAAYGSLLLRDLDQIVVRAEVAFPEVNLGVVANAVAHSAESNQYFVTQAYQRYLGRSPDRGGLNAWVSGMQQGLTDEQVEASFVASAEYVANLGGAGSGWVRGMYRDLLGRTPEEAGLKAWLDQLAAGVRPYDIAFAIAASAERAANGARAYYAAYLGRPPSQGEIDSWTGVLTHGVSRETVAAGFVASLEYYLSPAKGRGESASWMKSVYQDLLHRPASDAEANAWLAVLNPS